MSAGLRLGDLARSQNQCLFHFPWSLSCLSEKALALNQSCWDPSGWDAGTQGRYPHSPHHSGPSLAGHYCLWLISSQNKAAGLCREAGRKAVHRRVASRSLSAPPVCLLPPSLTDLGLQVVLFPGLWELTSGSFCCWTLVVTFQGG